MDAARREFGPDNRYDVRGFAVHRRIKAGERMRERSLSVYVVHKHVDPKHRVPTLRVDELGLTVEPDVVGVGAFPRAHDVVGLTPPMTGLYSGAAIEAQGRIKEFGGVACVLTTGEGPTHLLTAGHLFPTGQFDVQVVGGAERITVGTLTHNLLEAFPATGFPLDAALVELTAAGMAMARLPAVTGPRITGTMPTEFDVGIAVTAFLPTAHDYSRPTGTLGDPVDVQMSSDARGAYSLRECIGTEAVITNPGDSGTILFNGPGSAASAVGLCVGQFGAMSVFEPIDRVLSTLQQVTGLSLRPV